MAREGADLILCDVAEDDGLLEVEEEVRGLGRTVVTGKVDVRSVEAMDELVARGTREIGRLDIVVANAAIFHTEGLAWELTEQEWREMIDVNLTGTWNTTRAAIPGMIERDEGGSIVLIGAGASQIGFRSIGHYNASKHGVIGLMRTLANELAPHRIRVNSVSPSAVNTPMMMNERIFGQFSGGIRGATLEDAKPAFYAQNVLPNPWLEPEDVSNAVTFLASDEARYVTGVDLPVDNGSRIQPPGLPPSTLGD
jgi:(+)-trans-carveol dehydrogenase/(-)-trans-carveol dehydrogenase